MAGQIKLRAEEARGHAQDVRDTKGEVFDTIGSLRTRLDGLIDSFEGSTQEAFIEKLDEVKTGLDELLEALDGLGSFLKSAADTIEQLDTDLATQLRG